MIEENYSFLREDGQSKLDAAGLKVRLRFVWNMGESRVEPILLGSEDDVREAWKLVPINQSAARKWRNGLGRLL
jgi:hypothetical protein